MFCRHEHENREFVLKHVIKEQSNIWTRVLIYTQTYSKWKSKWNFLSYIFIDVIELSSDSDESEDFDDESPDSVMTVDDSEESEEVRIPLWYMNWLLNSIFKLVT